MREIIVDYTIGNEVKKLKIDFMAHGSGHITMDGFYHGQAIFSQNNWQVYLNNKSELNNSGDIEALIQILTERDNKQAND